MRNKLVNGVEVQFTSMEEAARDVEELAWANRHIDTDDEIDLAELNRVLASEGSVLRGFIELMLDEINILRQRTTLTALPVRTPAQVKAGIKAKMRTVL